MMKKAPDLIINSFFEILKTIQPDIIGIAFDGNTLDIITPTGEYMSLAEFKTGSPTEVIMMYVNDICLEMNYEPFLWNKTQ